MRGATSLLRPRRPLVLAAGSAALAFCRSRGKRVAAARPPWWTPAPLAWARRGLRGRAAASRGAPAGICSSAPQFHLHLRLVASPPGVARDRGGARASGFSGGTSSRLLTLGAAALRPSASRNGADAPVATTIGRRQAGPATLRSALLPHRPMEWRPRVHGQVAQARSARSLAPRAGMQPQGWPTSPGTTRRGGAVQLVDASQSIRLGVGSWSRSRIPVAPIRSRAPVAQRPAGARASMGLPRPGSLGRQAADPQAAFTPASPRMQVLATRRPVELVWRANRSVAATAGDDPPAAVTSGNVAAARPAPPTAPAGRASDKGVVWAAALDPLLADRLADDVIRRIDRRARIERERRGL